MYDAPVNDTSIPTSDNRGLLRRFRDHVAKNPHNPAVIDNGRSVTFAELDATARHMATLLAPVLPPGAGVGVALSRGSLLAATALAAADLGAVYVPLGSSQPRDRLQRLANRGLLTAFVGPRDLGLPGSQTGVGPEATTVNAVLTATRLPEGSFYGIFTSGTTGEPRLVVSGESQLSTLLAWYTSSFGFRPGARSTLLVSTTFDVHIMELWAALTTGTTMVVVPDHVRADPDALLEQLASDRVTTSFLPTPIAEAVEHSRWPDTLVLQFLQTGGDRLTTFPRLREGVNWSNLYGPAEATVVALGIRLNDLAGRARLNPPPIGFPVAGTTVAILDRDQSEVAPGERGELWLAGPLISFGYAGDPSLTRQRFVELELDGKRQIWYRTGDEVSRDADGLIHFHGRLDDQIKVRGVRIEPGEIETHLCAHPQVKQAVVLADRRGASDATRLVACCVVQEGVTMATLAAWLTERLPPHLRPDDYHILPEIPVTTNSKVDRAALLRLVQVSRNPLPPAGLGAAAEAIWFEALPLARGDKNISFSQAGGTSLTAVYIANLVKRRLGLRIRPGLLLQQETLDAFLAQVGGVSAS